MVTYTALMVLYQILIKVINTDGCQKATFPLMSKDTFSQYKKKKFTQTY